MPRGPGGPGGPQGSEFPWLLESARAGVMDMTKIQKPRAEDYQEKFTRIGRKCHCSWETVFLMLSETQPLPIPCVRSYNINAMTGPQKGRKFQGHHPRLLHPLQMPSRWRTDKPDLSYRNPRLILAIHASLSQEIISGNHILIIGVGHNDKISRVVFLRLLTCWKYYWRQIAVSSLKSWLQSSLIQKKKKFVFCQILFLPLILRKLPWHLWKNMYLPLLNYFCIVSTD